MIRLFKAVQRRKIISRPVWEPKNKKPKELKKIAQKTKVPRFFSRGIVFKLRKRQPINNALALTSLAFPFYQNKSKWKSETNTTKEALISKVKKKNRSNKNVYSLKEHKSVSSYIVNTKPIKILQKKATFINMLRNIFLKVNPFFSILQKFTSLLLKRNTYLVRCAYPFIYGGLTGASTIGGFKKVLYNKILVQDRRLKPAYNRRKHNISHYMVIQNQLARLNKTFVYLGKNKLTNMIGLILKSTYPMISPTFNWVRTKKHNCFNNKLATRGKAIPKLVSTIEGQVTLLLWRNQFSGSLTKSRQDHRQNVLQNLRVVSKNNTVILLKE